MATGAKWIPPLPSGWEARFDHNQRAYFFINHATRTTTWDDPRFSMQQPVAQPQQPSQASAAVRTLGHHGGSGDHESHPLQELSPSHRSRSHSNSRSSHHQQHNEESSLSDRRTAAAIDKLKKDYPNATRELIGDLYRLCHENERETREQLNDLGFAAGANKTSATSGGPGSSSSPAHRQSPAKRELSDSEKSRVLNQLKGLFPSVDVDVIRISLDHCHYNLDEAKELVSAWEREEKNKASNRSSSRAAASASSSASSTVRASTPADLEPVSLSRDANLLPVGLSGGSGAQNGGRASEHSTPSRTSTHAARSATSAWEGASTSRGASPSHLPQHARARQVTKAQVRTQQRHKPQPTAVVTSQPQHRQTAQPARHSAFLSQAKGTDPSLRKGPDSSLLSSSYTQALGPNRSMVLGPDPFRVLGTQGSEGPDVTLRCGPQAEHRQENRNNNGAGLLVTL